MAEESMPDLITDDEKYLLDKYNDVLKARAAQVLTLFVAFAFAVRASEAFLDKASILAMAIPVLAGVLDAVVAKRSFQSPYAYELTKLYCKRMNEAGLKNDRSVHLPVGIMVIEGMPDGPSKGLAIVQEDIQESEKRAKYRTWFMKQHRGVGMIVFGTFLAIGAYATLNGHVEPEDAPAAQTSGASNG